MIASMIPLVMCFTQAISAPDKNWVSKLMQSPPAKAILLAHAQGMPKVLPETKATVVGGILVFDPALGQMDNDASRRIADLIAESRFGEAFDYVSKVRQSNPEIEDLIVDTAIRCELLSGHYGLAFKDAVVRVSKGDCDTEDQLLYLSLASAAMGHVYDGQARYCEDWVNRYVAQWRPVVPPGRAVQFLTPGARSIQHQVMLLSSLALGSKSTPEFLELALKLDPVNDLAAREAIRYYGFKGRYSDVRRLAVNMLDNRSSLIDNDYYRKTLAATVGQSDRPLHATIKP